MNQDKIVKRIRLNASRERVWRALTDSREFGEWFGVRFDGPFVAGKRVGGVIVTTNVDSEVAKLQEPYRGIACDFFVEKIEAENLFSFRWHPGAVEAGYDYSREATTLVEFVLQPDADGILLTVTESGFENLPLARRAKAFSGNEAGWTLVITLIAKHLARNP